MTDGRRSRDLRLDGLTESQIRSRVDDGRLLHPFHDVYVATSPATDEWAELRALFVRLPEGAALCRRSAALVHGFGEFVGHAPDVEVALPRGVPRPRMKGVRTHETYLPFEPAYVRGIPCTPLARTAVDLARTSRRLDVLAALDGAVRAGCTHDDLLAEAAGHGRLRGVRETRRLIPYADPGAQCRQESQIRFVAIDGGLPRPTTQFEIVDDFGIVRFYLDLAWEDHKIGAEYDGRTHTERERMRHDRARHNYLAANGWQMRHFTDVDLYQRPQHIVAVLRDALRSSPISRRSWS